jgi:membrane protein implicated in regulation of membrane protease activity
MIPIYWLIAFVALIGIEIATMALTTIWFAGGAVVAFLLALFDTSVELQLAAFVVTSFVLLFLTRPFASKYVNSHTVKTNAAGLIGKKARVTARIDNEQGTGSAVVDGQEWTARTEKSGVSYEIGTMVRIREIQGVKLIVEALQEEA